MDTVDFVAAIALGLLAFFLGAVIGNEDGRKTIERIVYQACETRQPLVIEMEGVKQVYACLKVQR